eukprot:SM000036S13310  [mRNA]  locus=s36:572480:582824:- [translate_table: standard]
MQAFPARGRRPASGQQLAPYELKCNREALSERLGPAEYYPRSAEDCEGVLSKEAVQSGYKEVIPGIEESMEVAHTLTGSSFADIWAAHSIAQYRETIRRQLRALHGVVLRKRKASSDSFVKSSAELDSNVGQVYGVPLVGPLLLKSGQFPELKTCGEDFRRKWMEDLAGRKRLRQLAEHVPHGFRKKLLFEALIRHNVPLLRATWHIRILYLNQARMVRPTAPGGSGGFTDKAQARRVDVWTKDLLEYAQILLEEIAVIESPATFKETANPSAKLAEASSEVLPVDIQAKWRYLMRLAQWHWSEGLVPCSAVLDWILKQMQDMESFRVLEVLLPVLLALLDSLDVVSQLHLRTITDVCLQWSARLSREPVAVGATHDAQLEARACLANILLYLLVAMPDSFVALEAFPISAVTSHIRHQVKQVGDMQGVLFDKILKRQGIHTELAARPQMVLCIGKEVAASVRSRAAALAAGVAPGVLRSNEGKVVQELHAALSSGSVAAACGALFDAAFCDGELLAGSCAGPRSSTEVNASGPSEVRSRRLKALMHELAAIQFLCDWAVSSSQPQLQASGCLASGVLRKLFAVSVLRHRKEELRAEQGSTEEDAMHQLLLKWLDSMSASHQINSSALQALIMEVVHAGLISPAAYVGWLVAEGVLARQRSPAEMARARWNLQLLRNMPWGLLGGQRQNEATRNFMAERELALSTFQSVGSPLAASDGKVKRGKAELLFLRQVSCEVLQLPCVPCCEPTASELPAEAQQVDKLPQPARAPQSDGDTEVVKDSGHATAANDDGSWWLQDAGDLDQMNGEASGTGEIAKSTSSHTPAVDEKVLQMRRDARWGASCSHDCLGHCSAVSKLKTVGKDEIKLDQLPVRIKKLKMRERRKLSRWLTAAVDASVDHMGTHRSGIGDAIGASLPNQVDEALSNAGSDIVRLVNCDSVSVKAEARWQPHEEEVNIVLLLLDSTGDFWGLVDLLLLLLKQCATSSQQHADQKVALRKWDSIPLHYLLSCLRRYERHVAAMDLVPKLLATLLQLSSTAPQHQASCREEVSRLWHAYKLVPSVQAWETSLRTSKCDSKMVAELDHCQAQAEATASCWRGQPATNWVAKAENDGSDHAELLRGKLVASLQDCVRTELTDEMLGILSRAREEKKGDSWMSSSEDMARRRREREMELAATERAASGLAEIVQQGCKELLGAAAQEALARAAAAAVVSHCVTATVSLLDSLEEGGRGADGGAAAAADVELSLGQRKAGRRCVQMHVRCLAALEGLLPDCHRCHLEEGAVVEAAGHVLASLARGPAAAGASQAAFHMSPETPDLSSPLSPAAGSLASGDNVVQAGPISPAGKLVAAAFVTSAVAANAVQLDWALKVLQLREGLARALRGPTLRTAGKCHLALLFWYCVLQGCGCSVEVVVGSQPAVAGLVGPADGLALRRLQQGLPFEAAVPLAYSLFCTHLASMAALHNNDGKVSPPPAPSQLAGCHRSVHTASSVACPAFAMPDMVTKACCQELSAAAAAAVASCSVQEIALHNTRALYTYLAEELDLLGSKPNHLISLEPKLPLSSTTSTTLEVGASQSSSMPLPARLFLHALMSGALPGTRPPSSTAASITSELIRVLNDLQPWTFHWQWVELRLLLNEQVLLEKLSVPGATDEDAWQSARLAGGDKGQLAECEKTFTSAVLSRLLVHPRRAALYSEAIRCLGRGLEDYLILQVKWVLEGSDMLFGRKSLRQLLDHNAQAHGFSTPPGYCNGQDAAPLVEEEDVQKEAVGEDGGGRLQPFATERALADLVLPCLARSSHDTCASSAADLVKQIGYLEQHISTLSKSTSAGSGSLVAEARGLAPQWGRRMGGEAASSPGLGRRPLAGGGAVADATPAPPAVATAAALQTSLWLRLQFLLPLLPIIHADRDQTARNMRQLLAPILLRLLGTGVVQEAIEPVLLPLAASRPDSWPGKQQPVADDGEYAMRAAAVAAAMAGESLFERVLSLLHAVASGTWAAWLKPPPGTKPAKALREVPPLDRDTVERMQSELDHMQLPEGVRLRIQGALPNLPPLPNPVLSAAPPIVPLAALQVVQIANGWGALVEPVTENGSSTYRSMLQQEVGSKARSAALEYEMELDYWMLLEEGTASGAFAVAAPSPAAALPEGVGAGSSASSVQRASACLRGAVRMPRARLTYVDVQGDSGG